MGISVVLLAYKEEENLKILLPQIIENVKKTGEQYEILVIDTKEPLDNTKGVCEEFGARYINQEEPAFAGAFKTGVKYARMDKFLILDSDGSHNPENIPDLYKKFTGEKCDVVIGSRYVKGGVTNDAKSSIIMSKVLNRIFRLFLGIQAKDISTDYRMYETAQLKQVTLTCTNYDVLQEVLLRLKMNRPDGRLKIGEVPIHFHKRIYGESKRQLLPFICSYIRTLFRLTFTRLSGNELLKNMFLYILFGGLAFVLDYGISALCFATGFAGSGLAASIIGNVCGFLFTFAANTYLNFKKTDKIFARFTSYGIICLLGMGISSLILYAMSKIAVFYVAKLIALVVVSAIQFVLNKRITYRD